jgi:rod shape-determining protein MreC
VPSFTTSRRRVIAALALTSALLITLDLQGNSAVGSVRRGFGAVFSPFEDAARVVTRPVENAWRGVRDYPDVADENRRLKERIAQQEADHLLWQAERQDYAEAMAAAGLDTSYGTPILARVISNSPSNFDQTVEIDKGSNDGLEIGQMVVVGQVLVGKITEVQSDRATVMLITDARFSVAVKVENVDDEEEESEDSVPADDETSTETSTDTSGPEGEESTTTTAAPETTTTTSTTQPADTTTTLPGNAQPNDPLAPPTTLPPETTPEASTPRARQNGSLEGRGPERNPYVVRVSDSPRFGQIRIGAVVRTSGGSIAGESLAPPNLLVGTVLKKIEQAGSGGDSYEIRPAASFGSLDFVAVLPLPAG